VEAGWRHRGYRVGLEGKFGYTVWNTDRNRMSKVKEGEEELQRQEEQGEGRRRGGAAARGAR
jgi:hypothetical protein